MGFVGIHTGLDLWDITIYKINLDPRERKRETEREREREKEREREREGKSCGGLSVCEMRFMRVGNKKFFFSLTSSYNELLEIVAIVTH